MSATQRELIEERWKVLMVEPKWFANDSEPSTINSKRWTKVTDELEFLGVLLVGEVNESDYESLQKLVHGPVWNGIRDSLIGWAEQTTEGREARQAA